VTKLALLLERLCARIDLSQEESHAFFLQIVRGDISETELAAVLIALKAKGESAAEIAGAALALRASGAKVDTGSMQVADTCGTGGDGAGTFNVSTAAAFVAAAGGLAVAKHGNRSVSSRCGSADVLEALGVPVDLDAAVCERLLRETGFCFLFAPRMHPGVRHATKVRAALGVRTMFNVLGPLANPACPAFQVLGTGSEHWMGPMSETLRLMGTTAALVVHGAGLDEIALHAETQAAHLQHGAISECILRPEDAGIERAPLSALAGGLPDENAIALQAVLDGSGIGAFRDAVALNAGALFWISGKADSFRSGVAVAQATLASGNAGALLVRYREACHDFKN
jgi:anthranilate phosphoribosyltransferase